MQFYGFFVENPPTFEFTAIVFLRQRKIIFIIKTLHVISCGVNYYNAGVVTQSRRIASRG
jgi:hypothetical protein